MWWLAHGEHDVPPTHAWLSPHETSHLDSIRFTKRRNEYLTRRWTAKRAIATVLELDQSPASFTRIEVRHRESGAPYVQVDGRMAAVDVSMSDRAGWAVCLVGAPGSTASGTLGIDLEVVESRSAAFVADFFTPAERAFVGDLPTVADRDEAANLIWSAKEAALKVQQVGLRVDTRTVEVSLGGESRPDGWSAMTVSGREGPMPGWWRRDGVFLLTIVFAQTAAPPNRLPTGSDLTGATPQHTWVERPIW
jgi:4'-phosphopantetheinyl transferase